VIDIAQFVVRFHASGDYCLRETRDLYLLLTETE